MKQKYIAIFTLAFSLCVGWNLLFDAPKTPKPTTGITAGTKEKSEPQGTWPAPLQPLETSLYPYLHFHQAMDAKIKKIPVYVAIGAISKPMQHAVVATEDRRFYSHGAIDPIGIGRAILTNIQSGETVEGGSTISQQVVKNVFLSQDRTFARKAQEFVMAFLLEQNYSKDEILEIYLNTAYFGANATGIDDAARTYFTTSPEKLDLAQASMLAGLVQAPTYYNPLQNYPAAKARQKIVLTLMTEQGYISPEQSNDAYKKDLGLQR